jgi:hypothetical protein
MKKNLSEEELEIRRAELYRNLDSNYSSPDDDYGCYFEDDYMDIENPDNKNNLSSEELDEYLRNINKEKIKTVNRDYSESKKSFFLNILRNVKEIQNSNVSYPEKANLIKNELWTRHGVNGKLLIGGLFGTIFGFAIFGTGGIGIAALGGASGFWGFLAGTTGGILVSSLIQNFEKE